MSLPLETLSLREISVLVHTGEISNEYVYTYFRDRAVGTNAIYNAFNTLPPVYSPQAVPTNGVHLPIAVKDVYCEVWVRTTASSKMLADYVPVYESTVTDRMKTSGYVAFWKTNMDEYAMWGSGENSSTWPSKNPWDISRIPGGSSSGSAVAVAAGMVPAALGTDTGWSIRQPASMCGIVGFKPSYGRNSRYGVISMASSLDTPGYFTRTVRDAADMYIATAGYDPLDSTSVDMPVHIDSSIWDKKDLKGVHIGIPAEYYIDGIDAGVHARIQEAIDIAKWLGAEIVPISLPHTQYALAVYYIVCPAEVSTNMSRYDGIRYGHASEWAYDRVASRTEGLGEEVKRRILIGSHVLSSGFYDAYYKKASAVRTLIREDFQKAYEKVDVILTPTAPTVAWKIGSKWDDPLALYLEDVFTVPASLAGIPGMTIPCGYAQPADDDSVYLPVGLQILGGMYCEEQVLSVGHVLEQAMQEKVAERKVG